MQENIKYRSSDKEGLLQMIRNNRLMVALFVVLWFFLFLTSVSKTYSYHVRQGFEIELDYIILRSFLIWGIAVLFAPLVIKMARRFPLGGEEPKKHLFLHIIVSIFIIPVHASLYRLAIMRWYPQVEWSLVSFVKAMPTIIYWLILVSPLTYWLIIATFYLKTYYEQYRDRQVRNAELEAELASIQLHVLKLQLHPHFLFNTLHNINSLIYEAPDLADQALDLLKDLLRKSVEKANRQQVRLSEEVEFTRTYLEIEKMRFGDKLSVEMDIEDQAAECYIPTLMLQPLVENSVKHGISQRIRGGKIRIVARTDEDYLTLTVEDDGPGPDDSLKDLQLGIGLNNNIQRLKRLYEEHHFDLSTSESGGARVTIRIPVRYSIEA